jgi:hypothetical protein
MNNQKEFIAPGEMRMPAITAWMVERHDLAAHGIGYFNLVIFVVIAALARKREVFQRCRSTLGAWNDVLDGERLRGIAGLAAAVFAALICTLPHLLA